MFEEIYNKLLYDLKNDIKSSPIFKHHIELIDYSNRFSGYEYTKNSDFNDIVTDYHRKYDRQTILSTYMSIYL